MTSLRFALRATLVMAALLTTPQVGVAQAAPPPVPATPLPITFFGEVRTRSEWDRPGGAVAADAFTYLRSRFGVRVGAAPGARVVLQVQDSRVLGAEGNAAAASAEAFDLHQGYLELSAPLRGVAVAVRAGRQEIALANERLVGAVGWSNVGRSFDGVRLLLTPGDAKPGAERWTATAFGATVEERGRHFGGTATAAPSPRAADHAVVGLFASRALPSRASIEATALYDAGAAYRAYRDARRTTLDIRLQVPRVLGVRVELEGAMQAGRQRFAGDTANVRPQDVRAWLLGARLGTPTGPTTRASVTLGVDALSGDATPADGRYSAFGTMYATNHPFYGVMDLIGDPSTTTKDRGLFDALATGNLAISPAVGIKGEVHRFALATGNGRDLGWEADVLLPVRLTPTAGVELGYSAYRAGHDAAAVGLGADGAVRNWAYLQLRAGF